MTAFGRVDDEGPTDWGRTSADYAIHRPGPPPSFFSRLMALGVGLAGQRILDLGTGTGLMARQLARQGATVVGVDIAAEQIRAAERLAAEEGLDTRFKVAQAEATGLPGASFDVITALQCWPYFDRDKAVSEVLRLLAPDGMLVTAHFSWLPRRDPIARASEELVLRFNPHWRGADWPGRIPPCPAWVKDDFEVAAMFWYDEPIAFTRESWRGRVRACRGTGATLDPMTLAAFDAEHEALLKAVADDRFTILHRVDAHLLRPVPPAT